MAIPPNHPRDYWEAVTVSGIWPNLLKPLGFHLGHLHALFQQIRTVIPMNLEAVTQNSSISPEVEAHISSYKPRDSYSGQWERLREQILNLIRKAEPQTKEKSGRFLSALGSLLAEAADSHFDGPLEQLLTQEGIERSRVRLNSSGQSLKRVQVVGEILTHLHRVLHDLPSVISDEPQKKEPSKPFTIQHFEELVQFLRRPRGSVQLNVTRRLILALGAGLIGERADEARIFFGDRGISAILDANGDRRPLSKNWISRLSPLATVDLELYKVPDAQLTSTWLRELSLSYLWPRLRDEWLLEQLDGTKPAFVQFRSAGVTEYDLDRMVLRWNQIPSVTSDRYLRNPKKYVDIECAPVATEHGSHRTSTKRQREGRIIEMSTTTLKKPSMAEVRRMNNSNVAKVATIHQRIPKYHQQIMNGYTCKSAAEQDREKVHLAFVAVMERTSHILSVTLFRKVCSDVSALTAWAASQGRDLAWQSLMSHQLIDDYARVEKRQGNTASLSQRYRRLKCLASKLNPGVDAPPAIAPVGHKAVSDPYSAAEMAAIIRIASTQDSESVTRQLAFILGVCRGAGAAVTELRELHAGDIDDRGESGVYVTLGRDERRRVIPVRREWENYVRRGVAGLPSKTLVIGTVRNRKNIAGEITSRVVALGKDTPHIEASRLRTTWIAELMGEAIPVQVLLHAAGLKSARTLTDLAKRYTQDEITAHFGLLKGNE